MPPCRATSLMTVDMAILIAYLKTLSAELSPGVGKDYKYIRFATVIAGDVPDEDRKEMLAILDAS